jgi:putative MATE family efflux protein
MQDPRHENLERFVAHPRKAIWTLAVPMIGGMLFHAAYSVLNTVFVGSLGPEALAAITFVGPVFFVSMAISEGLASGVTAVIAQAVGRGDAREADVASSNALTLSMGIGFLLSMLGHLAGPSLLEELGAEGGTVEQAWAYFVILVWGIPLFFLSSALRAVLTGEGDSRTPMIVLAVATGLNAALDALFIWGLGMGIEGAGYATLLAQVLSLLVFGTLIYFRRGGAFPFHAALLLPQKGVVFRVFAIGGPAAASQLVMSAGMMLGNKLLSHFGQVVVAGFGAASRMDMIVALPVIGLAGAAVALIGMFAGAGRADLVRSTTLYAIRWALLLTAGLGTAVYLASDTIMGAFTEDVEAARIGLLYYRYMLMAYPLMAVGMITSRVLQGLGHGLPPLVITVMRLGIGLGLGYVLVYHFDAPVERVWMSLVLGGFLSLLVGVAWLVQVVWRGDPTRRATARSKGSPGAAGPSTLESALSSRNQGTLR